MNATLCASRDCRRLRAAGRTQDLVGNRRFASDVATFSKR
jgi:hypothetical protein